MTAKRQEHLSVGTKAIIMPEYQEQVQLCGMKDTICSFEGTNKYF